MIETTVLDYLRDRLGVPVTMEVPEGASGTFVVLEKTGSSRQNYIRRASFGRTELRAHVVTGSTIGRCRDRSHAGFAHA